MNLPLALSALLESSSPGFGSPPEATRYGDHIVVRAPLLAHAALQQRLAQIASPAMLARVPTTITLLADDEPLGEALERWSLAERVPLIVIEPGELEPHLVRRITCNVQAMPWADFLRTQKIELTAVNAGGVLMLRPRRPNDDHPFDDTQTELIDLRAMRAKYPEIDNRQLVEWLVAATDVGGPYSERLFDDDRSLVATGDVLIVRHLPETIATVRKQVAKLAMGAFTELPRPALLFSDDPQRAIDQYLAALASTADEDLASFAAYWLCQTRPLDSAQVAPLIRALDACDLRARPRLAQAICRVLAAHRTAAGDALPVLVAKFDHAAPAPVRSALLAALGSLGADSAVPLAKLMRHAQRDDAEQIVCHLWTLGDDARPALPLLLSWALIDTTAPDKRVCRALFNRGGLVHRLDPDAIQLAECLRQWEVHTDAKYRAAFAKADAYFRAWPEYIAAQEHAPLAVEDIPFLQRYTWPPFHRAGEGEMFWNDADDIEQGAMP